jgi:hypothetical protein
MGLKTVLVEVVKIFGNLRKIFIGALKMVWMTIGILRSVN